MITTPTTREQAHDHEKWGQIPELANEARGSTSSLRTPLDFNWRRVLMSGQFGRVQAAAADPLDAHDHTLLGIWAAHQRVTFEPVIFGELPLLGWQ